MALLPPLPSRSNRRPLLGWLGWLALANGLLLALLGLQYAPPGGFSGGWPGALYFGLALSGHLIFLALLAWPLLAALALAWPRPRPLLAAATLAYSGLGLLILLDTQVFALYRFHLNALVLNLLTGGAAGEIFQFSWGDWLRALLLVAAMAGAQFWLAAWLLAWCGRPAKRHGRRVALLVACWMFTGQFLHAWAEAAAYTPFTRQVRLLPWPQPLRMGDFFAALGVIPPPNQLAALPQGNGLRYPARPLDCHTPQRPYNILLLVIDSWRFDMLAPDVTPNLWRLGQSSQRFTNHYAAGNETRFGIFGTFYGLYGNYWPAVLGQLRGPVLVDQLLEAGYTVQAFPSAPLVSPEFDRTVFARLAGSIRLRTQGATPFARDRQLTQDFLAFLGEKRPGPFFAFLFYDAPHAYDFPLDEAPFQPSWKEVSYLQLGPSFDPAPFRNRYKNSLYHVDKLVGRVVAALAQKGLEQNTIIVATGDHGQEFNELGLNYWGHGGNFGDFQARVPLLVRWPGMAPAQVERMTSQLDVAPTLLQKALGCANPPQDYANGQSLFDPTPRPFALVSSGTRTGLIHSRGLTLIQDFGEVETLDRNHRPRPMAPQDQQAMRQALEGMSRFQSR